MMRSEVRVCYAVYEKIEGVVNVEWRCIGVSNRSKDVARVAAKAVDIYLHESDTPGITRIDFIEKLAYSTVGKVHRLELSEDFTMSYYIQRLPVPTMSENIEITQKEER